MTTYMGYELNENIDAGRPYAVLIPATNIGRHVAARKLIQDGGGVLRHVRRNTETWDITPDDEAALRDLRFAVAKYGVEIERAEWDDDGQTLPLDSRARSAS